MSNDLSGDLRAEVRLNQQCGIRVHVDVGTRGEMDDCLSAELDEQC